MSRKIPVLTAATLILVGLPTGSARADDGVGESAGAPGAPGIGDPYYPLDGNGGYDVAHYDLDLTYDPATDVLTGVAAIDAAALEDLSSFNLDLVGLEVRSVTVDGNEAAWSRAGQELTITPEDGLDHGQDFTVVVDYDGVPRDHRGRLRGIRLHAHRRRRDRGGPAARRRDLVPGERPPARRRLRRGHRDGARGSRGDLERRPGGPGHRRGLDDLGLGRGGADGHLSGDAGDRRVRRARVRGRRHPVLGRPRPRPVHARRRPGDRRRPPRGRSPRARWTASPRSSTSCRTPSGPIRSEPPAGSSTTTRSWGSRWRPRRGRSTRRRSSSTPSAATSSSSTNWRTSGPGTCCASTCGSTSGSTRGSRPTPSGCGWSGRGSRRRRTSSTTSPPSPRPSSGRPPSATRARRPKSSSTSPCTTAAR